jgi:uncharacterized membrane protein YeaQ/YmgE (transglycosylase-associated protein family)
MALRIPGKGVSAAHIPYCFIQNAKPCSLSANWGPPVRLHSEAVRRMLSFSRKLETEIPAHSQSGGQIHMGIIAWIILGLIAGFIGSKIVNKSGEGFFLDIILGIVGAVVGGWLFSFFGAHGVTGLNIYSLVVAVVGATVVLVVYHAIRRAV